MPKVSAGLLMYRIRSNKPEFFLVHPGGPFWKNKDAGAWSIPKGQIEEGEDELETAKREFEEETGIVPSGDFKSLNPIKQKSSKIVKAWAFEGDCNPAEIKSQTIKIDWPRGKITEFPEVDKAGFFSFEEASKLVNSAQTALLKEVFDRL